MRIVRAGHLPPLPRLPDGHTKILEVPVGPLLGIDATARFPEPELRLAPGSVLALYTDRSTEKRDSDIRSDVERLQGSPALLGGGGPDDLADGLLRDVCHASPDRADDIALLLTEYAPPRR
ncbi:PP2C family protein-serine/threonine phosphatase [Streptomyces sp. NBC_00847]|uniref:PP2C family protein-serine/threonine phosphatase n=1 Tax=Streptomyces sp. NBC_00847 TaxID=2975850 RepID=UPI0022565912|nr:PP2C family protein-serine/threonine phosphatase [Streptomyces sp. NBC_00847]MCX4878986.1 serine/threonine-protein phosphatase [Streptomyces sp. NBC_00847]